ncbi:MAG: hypothetical protein BWY42_00690 [Candidatus Omnitrophica bacterium ADurb.Bin277]|nr:MAG: hypothetical protein BWY42_00690 [Candidatus Omnitrophica bacterium ADurb.Bin277]
MTQIREDRLDPGPPQSAGDIIPAAHPAYIRGGVLRPSDLAAKKKSP